MNKTTNDNSKNDHGNQINKKNHLSHNHNVNYGNHNMHDHHDTNEIHDNHDKNEQLTNQEQHENHDHHHHHDKENNHESHNHEGHDHSRHNPGDHSGGHHHHANFGEIFKKSLFLAIPIMILSPFMGLTETGLISFPYSDIVVAILSTILLIYGGKPFFTSALDEIKNKKPSMMALVSLGLGVSYLYSIYAVFAKYVHDIHVMDFFFEFASLVLIMLLGHWLEMKALGEAGDAQNSLASLLPKDAFLVKEDGSTSKVEISDLKVDDIVRVQAGENIPADGVIVKGNTRINESLLTGESTPVERKEGDEVIGGSTNGSNEIHIKINQLGEDSFISQVQNLVGQAQGQPSRAEDLANKVASWLFWIALGASVISFIYWLFKTDFSNAVMFAVTTLVIACPHALGLAIPLVISRSTSLGANRGLLVKDREGYELTSKADVIVLDKTGTLTSGKFEVLDTNIMDESYSEEEILSILSGIESGSSHPIAQSIISYVDEKGIKSAKFDSTDVISGEGVGGVYKGNEYKLISEKAYGKDIDIEVPKGATLSLLTENGKLIGSVALGDSLKDSSKHLIKVLKEQEIEPLIATGDNESAAKAVADELNVNYHSNMSPQDKYELIEKLKNEGKTVIMVGDGVNDAPSLALADVGIAIGAGTQVAIDSADIILTQSEPGDIESFIELSVNTNSKMKQNLFWGAGYNFIAIPLAAGILAPLGFTLSPAVGAILMSLSTVIVAINAMSLKMDK